VPEDLLEALSGDLSASQIDDVLALVRACTGYGPSLCSARDVSSAVAELLEDVGAVLLLGRADVLADAPVSECPNREHLNVLALDALAAPDGADRLVAALLSAQHPPRARVVALIGARGGLGTSTFLLHLARACAAEGARVAILDADPVGGLGLLESKEYVDKEGVTWYPETNPVASDSDLLFHRGVGPFLAERRAQRNELISRYIACVQKAPPRQGRLHQG